MRNIAKGTPSWVSDRYEHVMPMGQDGYQNEEATLRYWGLLLHKEFGAQSSKVILTHFGLKATVVEIQNV